MSSISCCMIARDAAATIERALASIACHVDELVVVDTGSVDATREIARRYATRLLDFQWCDDFAAARQFAHDACSSDWVIFLDADDEVIGGAELRARVATAPADLDVYMIRYALELDAGGRPLTEYYRERLVRRDRMRWVGRVHEVMVPSTSDCRYERFDGTYVQHHGHGDGDRSMARNVRLLELDLAERPGELRTQFYLGRDYVQLGRLDEGMALLEQYQNASTWEDERFMALVFIGHAYRLKRQWDEAYASDLRLLYVHPRWPQAYYALAQDCYYLHRWEDSVHYCEVGQSLPRPETNLFLSPAELESAWTIFQCVSLYHCGRLQEAYDLTQRALVILPNDAQHQQNAVYFERLLCATVAEQELVAPA